MIYYWQIPMALDTWENTAFATSLGLYHFQKLPFGLHEATASFQLVMDPGFRAVKYCTFAYIDDILVFSSTKEDHLIHL